ncbi:MAG: monovalent cation/H+ antiporter subunit D family protein [Candidatus Omnitrophota bacterium]|nr:MAG: monovalent cation/H+ antiporter subunit D family protein [Candidatus Omnitrophota bacterium]
MSIIPLFVVIPLGCAFLISLLGKRIKGLSDSLANLGMLVLVCLSIYSIFLVKEVGAQVYKIGGWIPPIGISMVLDGLSSFMLVVVNLVAFLVAIFSIGYMKKYTAKWKFYTLFMLMLGGMNGVIVTGDMFNLFVFLEIASIASYALVAFGIEHEELEASFKYMVMGEVASLFILLGIALLYSLTSTLNMADMARVLTASGTNSKLVLFVSVLFLTGFGLKAAIMPFHAWLPDAHPSAPAPISAMLSGLLIKVLGIYALIRIFFNVLGAQPAMLNILLILGTISMVAGGLLAIGQEDIKRMLAYSSISQMGYIVLAIGIATPLAILGALFHLINHAIFKSLLFLNSGAIEYSTGTRDLREMGGLNARMPITGTSSLIGSMSISGIPPLSGFWSKLIIIFAAIQSRHYLLALIAVLVSIVTLGYYLKLQRYAFFGKLKDKWKNIKEVPFTMRLSMVILALISIVGGALLIPGIREVFLKAATDAVYIGKDYAAVIFEAIK